MITLMMNAHRREPSSATSNNGSLPRNAPPSKPGEGSGWSPLYRPGPNTSRREFPRELEGNAAAAHSGKDKIEPRR